MDSNFVFRIFFFITARCSVVARPYPTMESIIFSQNDVTQITADQDRTIYGISDRIEKYYLNYLLEFME